MKILIPTLLLLTGLCCAPQADAQAKPKPQKVYRWVDDNGEVHFSESLPPDFQDRKHDVLDKQGITRAKDQTLVPPPPKPKPKSSKGELPRDSSGMQRPEPLYSAAEIKRQQDALLLLRYDSDQEILDAMQVEVNQLAYDKNLLEKSRASLLAAYDGNIREAAERQRAGLKVEPGLAGDIRKIRSRLAENQKSQDKLLQREDTIRQSFQVELEHYRELAAALAEEEENQ